MNLKQQIKAAVTGMSEGQLIQLNKEYREKTDWEMVDKQDKEMANIAEKALAVKTFSRLAKTDEDSAISFVLQEDSNLK